MTSPAAAAAILVLLDRTGSSANMIPFTFEITGMAAGAERRIGRRAISNDLTVVPVTRYAGYRRIVVARVSGALMCELYRRPGLRRMTGVALLRGIEMSD